MNDLITKLDFFFVRLVVTGIVFVVLILILRLIANYADWNFFGWPAVTVRRLTDPLVVPVRRALMGFGVDSKYAPLVTILITILLGWIIIQVTRNIFSTIGGVVLATQSKSLSLGLGFVLYGLLSFYQLLIFVRIVFSWVTVSYSNRLMRFLVNTTEPLLAPLRRTIPPVGMFDISPFVAFLIIWLFQKAVEGTLLRAG